MYLSVSVQLEVTFWVWIGSTGNLLMILLWDLVEVACIDDM